MVHRIYAITEEKSEYLVDVMLVKALTPFDQYFCSKQYNEMI